MTSTLIPDKQEPLYLGRSADEWLADFISNAYVEEMDDLCKTLVTRSAFPVAYDYGKVFSLEDDENFNLVCHALSCCDEGFLQKAMASLPELDKQKQARLVFCVGRMGKEAVNHLMQLLKNPSVTLRAAACLGIKEAFFPGLPEGIEESPASVQLMVDYLQGPDLSPEELDAFFERLDTAQASPERLHVVNAEIVAALVERLKDDYRAVRLAAIDTLGVLLRACSIEANAKQMMRNGLLQRLEDEHQAVRLAAMESLELLGVPESRLAKEDAELYRLLSQWEDCAAHDKAVMELVCNTAWEHLRKLSKDPCPTVRERIAETLASCKTGEGVRSLRQLEIRNLVYFLSNAQPITGPSAAVREETIFALQGLADEWEYPEENKNEKQNRQCCEKNPAFSLSRMQAEIRRLVEVPFEEVIAALRGPDVALRIAAVEALLTIRSNGQGVIPYVREMAADPCRQVRLRAQRVLRRMVKDKSGAPESHYGRR